MDEIGCADASTPRSHPGTFLSALPECDRGGPPAQSFIAGSLECSGRCYRAYRRGGRGSARDARRGRTYQGTVSLRRTAEDAMVEFPDRHLPSRRPSNGRSLPDAAEGRDHAPLRRPEPGGPHESQRHRARRRSVEDCRHGRSASRRSAGRRSWWWRAGAARRGTRDEPAAGDLWRGRVLPGLRRRTVHDGALDVAVWRPPSRHQSNDGGK
jgi:hypothetical protein